MNKSKRLVYNPFILKVIHSKLFYLDRLIRWHVNQFRKGGDNDRSIDSLLCDEHALITCILDDMTFTERLNSKSESKMDMYLINFEYILFRMTCHYTTTMSELTEINDGLFLCDAIVRHRVKQGHREDLMISLIEQYTNETYFSMNTLNLRHSMRMRVNIIFNVKQQLENSIHEENIRVVNRTRIIYDKEVVVCLIHIYYLTEFISIIKTRKATLEYNFENLLSKIPILQPIGNGPVPSRGGGGSVESDECEELKFITFLRDSLYQWLHEYIRGYCCINKEGDNDVLYAIIQMAEDPNIIPKAKMNDIKNSLELDEYDRFVCLRHDFRYNYYFRKTPPSMGVVEYCDFLKDIALYGAISHAILFVIRLLYHERIRHNHMNSYSLIGKINDNPDACMTCNYFYLHHDLHTLIQFCECHAYNGKLYGSAEMYRLDLDKMISHSLINIVSPLQGSIYKTLYLIDTLLYFTSLISSNSDDLGIKGRYILFSLINPFDIISSIKPDSVTDDFLDHLKQLVSVCHRMEQTRVSDGNVPDIDPMSITNDRIISMVLDIEIIVKIITIIHGHFITVEKITYNGSSSPESILQHRKRIESSFDQIYLRYIGAMTRLLYHDKNGDVLTI